MRQRSGTFAEPPLGAISNAADRRRIAAQHVDPQLGTLFRTMRTALDFNPEQAARALGTRPEVITALEGCSPSALPPWLETRRIVMRYGELLQIDVAPALSRLQIYTQAAQSAAQPIATAEPATRPPSTPARPPNSIVTQPVTARTQPSRPAQPAPTTTGPNSAPRTAQPAGVDDELPPATAARLISRALSDIARDDAPESEAGKRKLFHLPRLPSRRTAIGLGIPIGLVAATVISLMTVPTALQASLSVLPAGIGQSLKNRLESVSHRTITGPDGLKWIVVVDPRSRKADRLPVAIKQ